MRHIRKRRGNVRDHRFRGKALYNNKIAEATSGYVCFCGEPEGQDDVGREEAEHLLSPSVIAARPDWSADFCPECVGKLREAEAKAESRKVR